MPVESPPLRIALVGEGAMGHTHAEVLASLPGAALQTLVARDLDAGRALAQKWSIPHCSDDYAACLASGEVDAVVIASPSALHVEHGLMAAQAGLPCLIEIPAALDLAGAEALGQAQRRSGQVMMVAHSRRFSPAHRWLKSRIQAGTFQLHHLVAETYFLRRSNLNMFGQPRTWTDNLLWHHACHSVDLFAWLLESEDFDVQAQQGPVHPVMGIPMDMSIGLRERRTGQLLTLALSFNNKGRSGASTATSASRTPTAPSATSSATARGNRCRWKAPRSPARMPNSSRPCAPGARRKATSIRSSPACACCSASSGAWAEGKAELPAEPCGRPRPFPTGLRHPHPCGRRALAAMQAVGLPEAKVHHLSEQHCASQRGSSGT